MSLSRRHLLSLAPGALAVGAGLHARPLRAAPAVSAARRRFLFVYAQGGWDPTFVFAPVFGHAQVDMEASAEEAVAGGLTYVAHPDRPSVDAFLEANAHRTAFLNGFEVRSITHTRCQQLLFTGSGSSGGEDWAAILAATSSESLAVPSLVLSGPSYTNTLSSRVVRSGRSGQLEELLDGTALGLSDQQPSLLGVEGADAVDRYLAERTEGLVAGAEPGPRARYLEGYAAAQADLSALQALGLDLAPPADVPVECGGVYDQLALAVSALASGSTRCATVRYSGMCGATFDDHTNIDQHGFHWEALFAHLDWTLSLMDATPGPSGGTLAEETVVVVISEMGRHPQLNSHGGKDHWTFTSAMLLGAGVAGGRTVGAYDASFMGEPVDLGSGEVSASGVSLTPAHLGATLLALGDVDPGEWGEAGPVEGLIA